MPVIDFTFGCAVDDDRLRSNVEQNKARGLPAPGHGWAVKPALAVVGGAPNIIDRMEQLLRFDGDIWAINGTYDVLRNHGVDCAFFTIDALPIISEMAAGADRAILASCVDPSVIDALDPNASVELFDPGLGNGKIIHSTTTATAAPHLAIERGHTSVTFYGCGSAYGASSHAYKDEQFAGTRIYIETCRGEYVTHPGYYEQAKYIASCIHAAPQVFKEESGGLLGALVEDLTHDITHADRALYESITREIEAQEKAASCSV